MPNKRNPDLVELMRATYASVAAARTELENLLSLPSGYHRDLQYTKGALFHAFGRGLGALALLPNLLRGLQWKPERLAQAFDDGMFATDKAVELAVAGLPFREAYRLAAVEPLPEAGADPQASLDARVSPGGAGALGLSDLRRRFAELTPAA
jgi:argininosuccinate lyase